MLGAVEFVVGIYLQGVLGTGAMKAGAVGSVPVIVGVMVGGVGSGAGVSRWGGYVPWMVGGGVGSVVACGVLTTAGTEIGEGWRKLVGALVVLGVSVGCEINGPFAGAQVVLKREEVPVGNAVMTWAGGLGSTIALAGSAGILRGGLVRVLGGEGEGEGGSGDVLAEGLRGIRERVGETKLKEVLLGLDDAVTKTMYLPLGMADLSVLAATAMEWKSVKQKTQYRKSGGVGMELVRFR